MDDKPVAIIGSIEPFSIGEDFNLYANRLKHLLLLNKIKNDPDKKSFLISLGGPELYKTLCSLLSPQTEDNFTFENIIEKLTAHFKPKKNIIVECFKFFKRDQHPSETISDYIVELKQLSQSCDFGTFLDKALLIKFVCGLNNDVIQNRLLNDTSINSFEKACDLALTLDMTQNQVDLLRNHSVHVLQNNSFRSRDQQQRNGNEGAGNEVGRQSKRERKTSIIECYYCHKRGHIERNCWIKRNDEIRNKRRPKRERRGNNKNAVNNIDDYTSDSESDYLNNLYNFLACNYNKRLLVKIMIEKFEIEMEIDTGACVSVIHIDDYNKYLRHIEMQKDTKCLKVVTGDRVNVVGAILVNVEINCNSWKLKLYVLDGDQTFTPLLGRNWLDVCAPNWRNIVGELKCLNSLDKFNFEKYSQLFSKSNNSTIRDYTAEIYLTDEAYPIFSKPYPVPYGLRKKVEDELEKMCKEGVLVPVSRSRWASPIVIANKGDGSIRICVDCRRTVNRFVEMEHYVIPRVDDILASLSGWNIFCKLDLTGAYLQVGVTERSREILTINTHRGLYQYTRLIYGLKTAPQLFSNIMYEILKGLDKTLVYFDDILVGGSDVRECEVNLKNVLDRLLQFNVKVNFEKCKFFEEEIDYLGYTINSKGISPSKSKIQAVINAPTPTNKSQLKSYLGMINYYNHCIPNLSSELRLLHDLTKNDIKWKWLDKHQTIFEKSKHFLTDINVLTHYDPNKPIIISCDASPYGVGAVLSHVIEGKEQPVMFASSTLKPAERNYSQLHKEALAIVFAIRKFHKYIYGLPFTIESDHQPLREIFSDKKNLPSVTSSRLQRWAIFLSSYNYIIRYKKGSKMCHADALSRLPLAEEIEGEEDSINIFNILDDIPINMDDVRKELKRDNELSRIYQFVMYGWPANLNADLMKYYDKRTALGTENECLYYGDRIVIPKTLQCKVLELLHDSHIGIVRMKGLARTYFWWVGMDKDVEEYVKTCSTCCKTQNVSKQITTSWPTVTYPFERIHLDFCKIENVTILVIVDTFSKWIDAKIMKTTNASALIDILRGFFATFGLPRQVVSDNGPPFGSREYISFCENSGIECLKSPAYHPQSNGSAERAVQTVKTGLKKYLIDPKYLHKSWDYKINNFLLKYRTTPTTVTGIAPAVAIFRFKPKTLLDHVNPKTNNNLEHKNVNIVIKQNVQKEIKSKIPEYTVNEVVMYRNVHNNYHKWILAKIVKQLSTIRYCISINGQRRVAHINQLKKFCGRARPYYSNITYRRDNNRKRQRSIDIPSEVELRRSERIKKKREENERDDDSL